MVDSLNLYYRQRDNPTAFNYCFRDRLSARRRVADSRLNRVRKKAHAGGLISASALARNLATLDAAKRRATLEDNALEE